MAMGAGGIPIPIPGAGGKNGHGVNGQGVHTNPLKNEQANSPKLVAVGKNGAATADARAGKEFLKYAAMQHRDSRFAPNTKVQGVRNKNFTEMQMNFTGNPDGRYAAGTPTYQATARSGRAEENPVEKENIPAAMRKQVKDYFETINPK